MSQSTKRWIQEKVKSFHNCEQLSFSEVLSADMVKSALAAEGVKFRDLIFTPFVTLCLFLSQVLDPDHSCRAAVARLIVWLAVNHREPCAPESNSYCDARLRLPLGVIGRLVRQTAQEIDAGAGDSWLWKGRKGSLVDGATASMPDTPRNQRAYPQPKTQGKGLGFPLARMVAIISLATGVVRDLALGPYKGKGTGETALFRDLVDGLSVGEIVVGDRCFSSFFMLADLTKRGIDSLYSNAPDSQVRLSPRAATWRGRPCRHLEQAAAARMDGRANLCSNSQRAEGPRIAIQSRAARVPSRRIGARDDDARRDEVHQGRFGRPPLPEMERGARFAIHQGFLQMDVLRCRSPEMVQKEIWMHLLAYTLIRGVMVKAAKAHNKQPRLLSFKGTLQTMAAFHDAFRLAAPKDREILAREMLRALSAHDVGDRLGRFEPRANKRRPKPQKFLMEPRHEARKRILNSL
jgi:hypothetical protein